MAQWVPLAQYQYYQPQSAAVPLATAPVCGHAAAPFFGSAASDWVPLGGGGTRVSVPRRKGGPGVGDLRNPEYPRLTMNSVLGDANTLPLRMAPAAALPSAFDDWRQRGWVLPPRNQLACGSCWAFSVTSALADRLRVATCGRWPHYLSAQYLVSCDRLQQGCAGSNSILQVYRDALSDGDTQGSYLLLGPRAASNSCYTRCYCGAKTVITAANTMTTTQPCCAKTTHTCASRIWPTRWRCCLRRKHCARSALTSTCFASVPRSTPCFSCPTLCWYHRCIKLFILLFAA